MLLTTAIWRYSTQGQWDHKGRPLTMGLVPWQGTPQSLPTVCHVVTLQETARRRSHQNVTMPVPTLSFSLFFFWDRVSPQRETSLELASLFLPLFRAGIIFTHHRIRLDWLLVLFSVVFVVCQRWVFTQGLAHARLCSGPALPFQPDYSCCCSIFWDRVSWALNSNSNWDSRCVPPHLARV